MHRNRQNGFTLMELMIAVAVIAILAAIALPNYQEYVRRGNRAEGQAFLNDAAAREERWYAQNPTSGYVTATANIGNLAIPNSPNSTTGKYTLTVGAGVAADGGYLLTATPTFNDPECTSLTLNAAGVRGSSGTGAVNDCWH